MRRILSYLLAAVVGGPLVYLSVSALLTAFSDAPYVAMRSLWYLACFGGLVIFGLLFVIRQMTSDLLYGEVLTVTGSLTRAKSKPGTWWPYHFLRAGEANLSAPRATYEAVTPGRVYRLYYLRRSDRLVALELIDG